LTLDAVPARDLAAGVVDLSAYQRDGFLVFHDLLGLDEVEALRRETLRLSRGERGEVDGLADAGPGVYHFPYSDDEAVPVELPAGGAIIFNGYLLHRSLPNRAPRSLRRAVANHYMSAQSLLPWRPPRDGEHVAMVDDRDIVMVAGEDPYAYRGFEDRHRAYVRPDHEGGCHR
jgi:phytanoyl-CoA hydroxylase